MSSPVDMWPFAPRDRGGFARPGLTAALRRATLTRCAAHCVPPVRPSGPARPWPRNLPGVLRHEAPGRDQVPGGLRLPRLFPHAPARDGPETAGPGPGRARPGAGRASPRRGSNCFLFALTLVDRFRGEGLDAASDADAASAAAALAGTYDTASRGLIYEQRPDSIPAQRMADGIKGMFDELGHGRPTGFAADAAAVLRQVEDRVRAVQRANPADSRAFLDLAGRMARRLGGPASRVRRPKASRLPAAARRSSCPSGGARRAIIGVCVPAGPADRAAPVTPGDSPWQNAARFVTRARWWAAR